MKHLKTPQEFYATVYTCSRYKQVDVVDIYWQNTNLIGYENSPFHKVKGVVVEITGNDYLLDMTPNGEDFVKHWKRKGNLYGCDWNKNIPKTCKWFEKQQLIKV